MMYIMYTADYGNQYVNDITVLPGHHAPMVGDCIEGSSMGPIGSMSSHVTSPPRRAHTPPSLQQQLKWQALMVNEWHGLCDGALQDM